MAPSKIRLGPWDSNVCFPAWVACGLLWAGLEGQALWGLGWYSKVSGVCVSGCLLEWGLYLTATDVTVKGALTRYLPQSYSRAGVGSSLMSATVIAGSPTMTFAST